MAKLTLTLTTNYTATTMKNEEQSTLECCVIARLQVKSEPLLIWWKGVWEWAHESNWSHLTSRSNCHTTDTLYGVDLCLFACVRRRGDGVELGRLMHCGPLLVSNTCVKFHVRLSTDTEFCGPTDPCVIHLDQRSWTNFNHGWSLEVCFFDWAWLDGQ